MNHYLVDLSANFSTLAPTSESLKKKLLRVIKTEGFTDRNFELTLTLIGREEKKVEVKKKEKEKKPKIKKEKKECLSKYPSQSSKSGRKSKSTRITSGSPKSGS